MNSRQDTQEQLLRAWMEMSAAIRGNRLLSELSFNEIMVCHLLVRQRRLGGPPLTATELCAQTRLLKSQINHILTAMEDKGLIQRQRSQEDRRVVYVRLLDAALPLYQREHDQVLRILDAVYQALGGQQAQTLAELLEKATAAVEDHVRHLP
jgi:DNA-binding MarR family transcriptional regulator